MKVLNIKNKKKYQLILIDFKMHKTVLINDQTKREKKTSHLITELGMKNLNMILLINQQKYLYYPQVELKNTNI